MTAIILRRRKLGRGSTKGIREQAQEPIAVLRSWVPKDFQHDMPGLRYVFRWGCTATLNLSGDYSVVNTAAAIHWCKDKRQGRLDMQAAGVPVPATWGTWTEFVSDNPDQTVVLRPSTHAQGRNLFVFNGRDRELAAKCKQLGSFYISTLIPKVAEYRVFVCQNRAVWVAKKTPGNPEQVAWNVAQGGRFDNVRWNDWPMPVVKSALAAAKVSGTDFCGVDVMVDAEDNPYVLEVNSAPSQTSEYRQRCVAKAFDYIIENGKQHFDDVPDGPRRTYKSYIHPAVRESERSGSVLRGE